MPRPIGTIHPTEMGIPTPPSTVITFLLAGGGVAQAIDWPDDTGVAAANAAAAGIHLVRITSVTTGGGAFFCTANLFSTASALNSSGVTVSTTSKVPVFETREFQIPGGSTGMSLSAYTSGVVMVECWHK